MDGDKPQDDIECSPEKMRDSGLGSECITAPLNESGTESFILTMDEDQTFATGSIEDELVASRSSYSSATPLSVGQTTGDVFHFESHSFPPKCQGILEELDRKNRRSFKTVLQAVDAFVPVGKQRHDNFTPPRLSPRMLDECEEDSMPHCATHDRWSSACQLLYGKDLEKEIGENLRLVSDHFNVRCVGLEGGYHLQSHPHSLYDNKIYSSSYPGAPSAPDVHRESIKGVKVRRERQGSKPPFQPCR